MIRKDIRANRLTPAQHLLLLFVGAILLGTLLLMLPQASTSGASIGPVDALFTATSATCVTGLIVLDTPVDFTVFGISVILALIQVGGLGIMTFGLLVVQLLGRKTDLSGQRLLEEEGTFPGTAGSVGRTLIVVARWVFGLELVGAFLLLIYYRSQDITGAEALGHALFHSVSAFCNAGFALHSDSLMGYAGSWYFNAVIMGLIILGGIGFRVLGEVSGFLRRSVQETWEGVKDPKPFLWSYHTRLAVFATGLLLIGGTALFFIAERKATLAGLPTNDRLLRAMFLSTTARTAGFNTVDIARLSAAGVWFMVLLMAIGASPGGTGGGIKTTTVAVLVAALRQQIRNEKHAYFWNRRIPDLLIPKAIGLSFSFLIFFGAATFLLALTEPFPLDQVMFETMSALGTVGLSMGITPKLSTSGKLIITVLMLAGRLGPLTLVLGFRFQKPVGGEVLWVEDRSLSIG